MPYEASIVPQNRNVIDGDLRQIAKVTVVYFKTPTAKPQKAGQTVVRAWTRRTLKHVASNAARDLMHQDRARRMQEITHTIERIERVSLRKR